MIAENGTILAQARRFENESIYGEIDIHRLRHERRRMNTFVQKQRDYPDKRIPGGGCIGSDIAS